MASLEIITCDICGAHRAQRITFSKIHATVCHITARTEYVDEHIDLCARHFLQLLQEQINKLNPAEQDNLWLKWAMAIKDCRRDGGK